MKTLQDYKVKDISYCNEDKTPLRFSVYKVNSPEDYENLTDLLHSSMQTYISENGGYDNGTIYCFCPLSSILYSLREFSNMIRKVNNPYKQENISLLHQLTQNNIVIDTNEDALRELANIKTNT